MVGTKRDLGDVSERWQKKIPTTCRFCCWAKFYVQLIVNSSLGLGKVLSFCQINQLHQFLYNIWQAIWSLNIYSICFPDIYSIACLTYTLYYRIGISNLVWPNLLLLLPKSAPLSAFLISVNNTSIQSVAHVKKRLGSLFFTQTTPKKVIYNLKYIQNLFTSISATTVLVSHLDHCNLLTGLSIFSGYNPISTYQPRWLFL